MNRAHADTSDVAIFSRILKPDQATLPATPARAILALRFSLDDQARMRQLSTKAQEGTLTPGEQDEINSYERVGHVLSLWKSKARRSLKSRRGTNGKARAH